MRRIGGVQFLPAKGRAGQLLAACLVLALCQSAFGVVIKGGDGSGNTSAPSGFPYWGNIGVRGGGTGIYLGDRWVITAKHAAAGTISLNGQTYYAAAGSAVQITNADDTLADLLVYRLVTDPGLPAIPITTNSPHISMDVTMIGTGLNRQPNLTRWDADWNETTDPTAPYSGFKWVTDGSRTKRWGTNSVSKLNQWVTTYAGSTKTFLTTFNNISDNNECQAADNDSGGGVFRYVAAAGKWELAGIMIAIGPGGTNKPLAAVYNDYTCIADLSYYGPRIQQAMSQVLWGDFNADRVVNALDINLLYANFGSPSYDLTSDAIAAKADVDYLVRSILGTEYGDADLNGRVNADDLAILAANWKLSGGWAAGDFDGNGVVNLDDLIILCNYWNFGQTEGASFAEAAEAAGLVLGTEIPEPASLTFLAACAAALLRRRRPAGK